MAIVPSSARTPFGGSGRGSTEGLPLVGPAPRTVFRSSKGVQRLGAAKPPARGCPGHVGGTGGRFGGPREATRSAPREVERAFFSVSRVARNPAMGRSQRKGFLGSTLRAQLSTTLQFPARQEHWEPGDPAIRHAILPRMRLRRVRQGLEQAVLRRWRCGSGRGSGRPPAQRGPQRGSRVVCGGV